MPEIGGDFMSLVRIVVLIWWSAVLTQITSTCLGEILTNGPEAIRFDGTVTLVLPQRDLVVVQEETNVLAVNLDLNCFKFQVGDRVRLEGGWSPVNLWTITVFSNYPDHPSGREWCSDFTAPTNWAESYICRMRGFIRPPKSGDYRFWVASDDESELWLSSDDEPARARKVAFVPVPGWTFPEQWNKYPSQRSKPIFLEAGKFYYIEAVQVQHLREDNLAVAWQGPGMQRSVIAGQYLSPWRKGVDFSQVKGWLAGRTNGILREYWLNARVERGLDLTGQTPEKSVVRMDAPRVTILGHAPPPQAVHIDVGQPLSPDEDFRRVEVEAVVDFAAVNGNSLSLEVSEDGKRMQVRVLNWEGTSLPRLERSRVKLDGVCEAVQNENGKQVAGLLWVPRASEIHVVKPNSTEWNSMRPTRLADLLSPDSDLVQGQKVRVGGTVVKSLSDHSFVIRDQGCFDAYTSKDGTNWVQVGKEIEIPMSNSVCIGLAVCSCTNGILTRARFQDVRGLSDMAENDGVGPVLKTGTVSRDSRGITLSGSGADITAGHDSFQFLHQPLVGDGEILGRVNSVQDTALNGWARAGLMIRESLDPGSKFVMISQLSRNGVFLQYRIHSKGLAEGVYKNNYQAPTWIKLVRRHHFVQVASEEPSSILPGQSLDVVGFYNMENGKVVLSQAFYKKDGGATTIEGERRSMQLVSQYTDVSIRRLLVGPYLSSDGFRLDGIRIHGTVTFNGRVLGRNCFFVQDKTGAIMVNADQFKPDELPQVGQRVSVSGHSIAGKYAPSIEPLQITPLGWGELPEPVSRSIALTSESHGDGLWIELSGVVRMVRRDGTLTIVTPEGQMRVWINHVRSGSLDPCVDATVRLRGVLALTLSAEPMLLVPSLNYVETLEAPPSDPFAIPACSVTSLQNFDPSVQMVHRVRISGQVTWVGDHSMFLENQLGVVRVLAASSLDVHVGDSAEVVGFPARGSPVPLLTQSLIREHGVSATLKPITAGADELFGGNDDGRLVRVEAELIKQRTDRGRHVLELQIGRRIIEAALSADAGQIIPIRAGSQVAVTGVCRWESSLMIGDRQDEGKPPQNGSVEILLRSPGDVLVLHNPPWWTARRILSFIAVLIGILLASLAWIYSLRRRVEKRSRQLAQANARLAEESRNAAVLAERTRLAGEIHDSLQQGFTGIRLQLDAAGSKLADGQDAVRRYLDTAQSMIQYSLAEVKSALWNWQSPLLKEADLATALKGIARQIGAASPTRVEFEVRGQPQPLSPKVEHHLLRIGQEGITNAIKHADAKSIQMILEYSMASVRLTIRDDGCGFVPEVALNERGTHFGLSGLVGRARQLGSLLTIASKPGKGTSLIVVVPLEGSPRPDGDSDGVKLE